MKNLNFLIKPASSLCNMRCRYCFYEDEAVNRAEASTGRMTTETVDCLIQQAFAALDNRNSSVTFAFQGGEPTLAGLDYYRYFVEKVYQHNANHVHVNFAIQTNGLMIDEQWAVFLAANRFLVGISMDGTKALHDELRPDAFGRSTWARVTKALSLLQKNKVDTNILCVVTRSCAKSPVKVYHTLQKLGGNYLQFTPCLDPLGKTRGSMPYSITPELYGHFLCGLFDEWYRDWQAGRYTSVRLFDDYIYLAMGIPAGTCATSGSCGNYLVVEGNGSLYPCDFYCLDEWKLGVVKDTSFVEIMQCDKERRFLKDGAEHPAECNSCRWRRMCFGGCKRDWYVDSTGKHNYLCGAFQMFFEHSFPRIEQIAKQQKACLY